MNPAPSLCGTRARLLEAAAEIFAERGYADGAVREVTGRAGANLAAVGYHFGSKEKLFQEAVRERLRELNGRRRADLAAARAAAAPGPIALEAVLRAFAGALVEEAGRPDARGRWFQRMVVRAFADTEEILRPIFAEEMLPAAREFVGEIVRGHPHWPVERIVQGVLFYAGSMVNLLCWLGRPLGPLELARLDLAEAPRRLDDLVAFGAAGLRALGGPGPEAPTAGSPPGAAGRVRRPAGRTRAEPSREAAAGTGARRRAKPSTRRKA